MITAKEISDEINRNKRFLAIYEENSRELTISICDKANYQNNQTYSVCKLNPWKALEQIYNDHPELEIPLKILKKEDFYRELLSIHIRS